MSAPPVEPLQPETALTVGKVTLSIPDCGSLAVAFRVNEPEPEGRKYRVLTVEFQYCAPAPVCGVGAVTATVGTELSIFASVLGSEGALTLPTLSEIV